MFRKASLVMVIAVALTGCGSDDDVTDPCMGESCRPYPAATSQDIAIENLVRAFNERSSEEYESLLEEE